MKSVLNQNYKQWELIVVGDQCTDDTEAVVRTCQYDAGEFAHQRTSIPGIVSFILKNPLKNV